MTSGEGSGEGGGGSSSLKETFEMYRREHQREHSNVAAANEVRMKEHQHAHDIQHTMREDQLKEREARLDIRLAGMNEIREQLNDQARTFMRTETAMAKFSALEDRLSTIEKIQAARAGLEGKADGLDTRLDIVEKEMVAQRGQRGGASATLSYIMMAIGAVLSLLALYSFFAK